MCLKTMPVNNSAVYSETWLYVSFDAATIVSWSRKLWDS